MIRAMCLLSLLGVAACADEPLRTGSVLLVAELDNRRGNNPALDDERGAGFQFRVRAARF